MKFLKCIGFFLNFIVEVYMMSLLVHMIISFILNTCTHIELLNNVLFIKNSYTLTCGHLIYR